MALDPIFLPVVESLHANLTCAASGSSQGVVTVEILAKS